MKPTHTLACPARSISHNEILRLNHLLATKSVEEDFFRSVLQRVRARRTKRNRLGDARFRDE